MKQAKNSLINSQTGCLVVKENNYCIICIKFIRQSDGVLRKFFRCGEKVVRNKYLDVALSSNKGNVKKYL